MYTLAAFVLPRHWLFFRSTPSRHWPQSESCQGLEEGRDSDKFKVARSAAMTACEKVGPFAIVAVDALCNRG